MRLSSGTTQRLFWAYAGGLLVLLLLAYRDFWLGNLTFVFKDLGSDSYVVEYPALYSRMQALQGGHLPDWSFNTGLGQNIYPFSFEPVSAVLFSLGVTAIPALMLLLNLTYLYLAGLFMFGLLSELRLHGAACGLGGLAYTFSGYSVLSASWVLTNFAPQAFQFVFLLWAIERTLNRNQWIWLALAVALIGVNYPVNLYFGFIVAIGYTGARAFRNGEPLRTFRKHLLRLAPVAVSGIGLSAFMLLPTLYGMAQSPRGTGSVQVGPLNQSLLINGDDFRTTLARLFNPNLPGNAAQFQSVRNYLEAPLLYCSLLMLLAILSGIPSLSRRGKSIVFTALSAIAAVYLSPLVRQLVWLHLGDYYRVLNLLAVLVLVLIGSVCLSRRFTTQSGSVWPLVFAGVGCVSCMVWMATAYHTTVWMPLALLLLTAGLLGWQRRLPARFYYSGLAVLLSIDLLAGVNALVLDRGSCTEDELAHQGYHDAAAELLADLHQQDTAFYRTEKDFYSGIAWLASFNEAILQQYFSSATYGPFNSAQYTRFLTLFGVLPEGSEPASRFVAGLRDHPLLMKLCATRYFISTHPVTPAFRKVGFVPLRERGPYTVWKDTSALPFGFCYRQVTDLASFRKQPAATKLNLAFGALALNADRLQVCKDLPRCSEVRSVPLQESVAALKADTLTLDSVSGSTLTGTIALKQSRVLFLSMPYDQGWNVLDNTKETPTLQAFGGLTAIYLPAGLHRLQLHYQPPFRKTGRLISLASLGILLLAGIRP